MNISEKIFQVLATCLLVSVHSRAAVQDVQHRESADVRTIAFEELKASLDSDSITLIDVRNQTELASQGRIPKSFNVPLPEILNGAFEMNPDDFYGMYGFIKPSYNDEFVVSCKTGKRASKAAEYLISLGYRKVIVYQGSFTDWVANGGEITKSDQLLSKVFTTGYSDQLLFYTVNEETGHVSFDDTCAVQPQLSFGHVSQRYNSIYFVHLVSQYNGTLNTGAVSRWEMNRSTMEKDEAIIMKEVFLTGDCGPNQKCMSGEAPCHVIVDEENGILHVANYGVNYGGSYIAYSIDKKDGTIQQMIYFEDYGKGSNVDPARQENAHANMVYLIKNFVYVVDLGSDKIHRYKVMGEDSKEIVYQGETNLPPGFGPKHMTATTKFPFQDGYQRVYVINELQPAINIFKHDEGNGTLFDQGVMETINTPGQAGAEIMLHPTENWLYCSNRGEGAILVYRVLPHGYLEQIQIQHTAGSIPKHFTINELEYGDILFVADQDSNTMETFLIDGVTGKLTKKEDLESGNNPTFIGLL